MSSTDSLARAVAAGLVAAAFATSSPARAETSVCTPITSLPATLAAAGTYCLVDDLATTISAGAAIAVEANNVTIDCNDHAIAGAAGTAARGIATSQARQNVVIRGCNLRGFRSAIRLVDVDGYGHLVEGNRVDGSSGPGLHVEGDGSRVRDNLVRGATGRGIYARGAVDVIGNAVQNVSGAVNAGIYSDAGNGSLIAGNRIRGVSGHAIAVVLPIGAVTVAGNTAAGSGNATGLGIRCVYSGTPAHETVIRDNLVTGPTQTSRCLDAGGNVGIQ